MEKGGQVKMRINNRNMIDKRGQVAIFIIVAILIAAGTALYFVLRDKTDIPIVSTEFAPVYSYYSSCIEEKTKDAIDLAGSQAGYVYPGVYIPGSDYAPFSNQLNFMGFPVSYWYYVSGNGVIKEQVPNKADIENEISRYIEENINNCDFEVFYAQGFSIDFGEPNVKTAIEENKIVVDVMSDVSVSREESSAKKTEHKVELNSKFGKFYRIAREIYDKEKNEAFLENYSTDVLRLYAPVDGVELMCKSKVWKTTEVVDELKNGLEANIAALKFKGGDYSLQKKEDKYFVIDKDVDENINLIYSSKWPTKIEISGEGVDSSLMVARTVGNQEGLGMMGFCYAPYHFIYDLSFPVLIQIYNDEEIFQFPVAVIIDKNLPRKAEFSEIVDESDFDLCEFKNQDVEVNIYDINLDRVDGDVGFACLSQECLLGESENGVFVGKAPSCVNGYLKINAEGYAEKKQLFSSNRENYADIVLDKEYEERISVYSDGKSLEDNVIIMFEEVNGSRTVGAALPDSNEVKLSEGHYKVSVYAYGNSSIIVPESKKTQCVEVPKSGIAGLFGGTKEQCFDIKLPETKIESALIGGGKSEYYFLPSELEGGSMRIDIESLPVPKTLEEMQVGFALFEGRKLNVEFTR